jgi:hypothetical protein
MAAVPNDIAMSQAEALSASAPAEATPQKTKKARAATVANDATAQAATASSEAPSVAPNASEAANASEVQKADTTGGGKKNRTDTPWYVARAERTLRNRANQSFPILTKRLTLQSFHAQDMLQRSGENWAEAMITLSETMRNFKPEEQCIVVDGEVDRLLNDSFKAIKTNIERLNKLAEANGLDMEEIEAEYSSPSTYVLKVLSPREFRFHTLLQELDKLCALTDKMWYVSLVTDRHRSQIPFETKRQIIRMVNRVRTLVYRAQASSQRAGAPDAVDPRVGTAVDPALKKKTSAPIEATEASTVAVVAQQAATEQLAEAA